MVCNRKNIPMNAWMIFISVKISKNITFFIKNKNCLKIGIQQKPIELAQVLQYLNFTLLHTTNANQLFFFFIMFYMIFNDSSLIISMLNFI